MGGPMVSVFSLIILCLLGLSVFLSPSSQVSDRDISTICSQTHGEEQCQNFLKSDPRTPIADLSDLALIAINLTINQANVNYKTYSELSSRNNDTSLKQPLENCVGIYEEVLGLLSQAYQLASSKDYKNITQLGNSEELAYKCEMGIPDSSSTTAAITQTLTLLCQTAYSVVNLNLYRLG